jgi:hypothetical protein
MPDERNQFIQSVPIDFLDPWLAYDSWGIELACKLITLGYPVDIERMIDEAKSWEPGCEGIDRLHSMLLVYNRALSIAKSSVNAGLLENPDTLANWLTWAKRKGYDVAHLESMAAPVLPDGASGGVELDYSLLATREQLLDAFGKWGLKPAWFNDLHGHQWLLDARRIKGQGQRGHGIDPMFCPFAVMSGLIESVRKKTRLKPDTAWRVLAHKFPKVYAKHEGCDPRDPTGD